MTEKPHLGGCVAEGDPNTIMPDVWTYLMVRYGVKSVLDIGCGFGQALRFFKYAGVICRGIEAYAPAIKGNLEPDLVLDHDFCDGPVPDIGQYDLGWSAEFVEHVDAKYMDNIFSAFKRCKVMVITYATPGQGGTHHVNEQELPYWIDRFKERGFSFNPIESTILRRTDKHNARWGRKTLSVFEAAQ